MCVCENGLSPVCVSGHTEAVQKLLESGADPRIRADDGCTPHDIGTDPTIKVVSYYEGVLFCGWLSEVR